MKKCSKYFSYRDFFECSDTYKSNPCDNTPKEAETYKAIENLSVSILDKVYEAFGPIALTYGFCSFELSKKIKKNIYPKLDQHSGYEKRNGKFICERLGFASDFYIPNNSSLEVARYIVSSLPFDRIYYYGSDNPIHVSTNDNPKGSIVLMPKIEKRRMPRRISKEKFLNSDISF